MGLRVVDANGETFSPFLKIGINDWRNGDLELGLPAWNRKAGEAEAVGYRLRRAVAQVEIPRRERCVPLLNKIQTKSNCRR